MKDSDIKAVADALIESAVRYVLIVGKFYCFKCGQQGVNVRRVPHITGCPALIAEKLLEEMKAESHDLSTNTGKGVWYQSAVSGLWYTNKKAVGACCAVMTDGKIVYAQP